MSEHLGSQCECLIIVHHIALCLSQTSHTKQMETIVSYSATIFYNAHTHPIFKQLKLLKVKDILKLQELKFYFKYINRKLPYYLQSLPFSRNSDIHHHELNTRHAKQCIRFDLPKVINSTPRQILDKIHTHSL